MAYGVSNGHVIDDVTWPRKVKLVTPIRLERNISKTAGDALQQQSLITRSSAVRQHTVGYPCDSLASCCKNVRLHWLWPWIFGVRIFLL